MNRSRDRTRERWEARWKRVAEADVSCAVLRSSWLDPWLETEPRTAAVVLELGSGAGVDTLTLTQHFDRVIALDYASESMARVGERAPRAMRTRADLRDGLPFASASVCAVVAGLCLHYFDARSTYRVASEIARCLRPGGKLVARVNSTRDVHYGATGHPELETHYYSVDGHSKRFFDRADVIEFFGTCLTLDSIREGMVGTDPEKYTWEFRAAR